jgi:hypothetical protein
VQENNEGIGLIVFFFSWFLGFDLRNWEKGFSGLTLIRVWNTALEGNFCMIYVRSSIS